MIAPNLFGSHELAIAFHPYQQTALDTLLAQYHQGQHRLHLVSPPGSGKTLMGLELARRIGHKTVILSPTTPIQQQWVDKFTQLSVDLEAMPELDWRQRIMGTQLADQPAILSLTYQSFSTKGKDGQLLHDHVHALFAELERQGYQTLLLDECHHLLAHWAAAIQHFLEQVPDSVLVGLTATPPADRQEKELAVYFSLVGEVDYEVPTPAVIKEGHLAPFQDLVWLVRPTEAESTFVSGAHQDLHALLHELEQPSSERPTLAFWAEEWLLHPTNPKGQPLEHAELLTKSSNLTIALVRYLYSHSIYPPGIPWCTEMEEPPSLEDLVECLGAYGQRVLQPQATDSWKTLKTALEQLGYRFRQGKFRRSQGQIDRILALSAAKLRAVEHILCCEQAVMGSQLRVLILTDFETTHAPGGRAADNLLDPQAGGALAVMRYLCHHPVLDELHPLMVTGQTLLCDDDLLPQFLAEAQSWFATNNLQVTLTTEPQDAFYQIHGQGKDWKSSTYLALVTDLLEQGITRCLVGTRGLLGEGWDCLSLNTLIDLTAVSSFVAVNQIRGRSLRFDPNAPLKVSNNWDVVALLPELEGGFRDLERFQRKHQRFYGLSEDGYLEQGAGHVHSLLGKINPVELLAEMDALNREMQKRAGERRQAWERWEVGKPYHGRDLSGIQLRLPQPQQPRVNKAEPTLNCLPVVVLAQAKVLQITLSQARRHHVLWRSIAILALLGSGTTVQMEIGLPLALMVMFSGEIWLKRYRQNLWQAFARDGSPLATEVQLSEQLARVVVGSLQASELIQASPDDLRLSQRSDGSLRLFLETSWPEDSACFAQALQELLEPLQEQRYVLQIDLPQNKLQRSRWGVPKLQIHSQGQVYLPVPRLLARTREKADIFARCFNDTIGPATLIYTRQGEGRKQLQHLFRRRAVPLQSQAFKVWE